MGKMISKKGKIISNGVEYTGSGVSVGLSEDSIADNLITDDSSKVLSAKQGKVLNDELAEVKDSYLEKTGDSSNTTATFTESSERENIVSGEKHSAVLGKISKWFSDLKSVAFSNSYNDLQDVPTIPEAVSVKGDAESEYRTGEVNITPANIGLDQVDNTPDADKSVKYATSAGTAESATKATQDSDGNIIADTYVKATDISNVENKSSETIRSEITKTNVTTALKYTPYTPTEVDSAVTNSAHDCLTSAKAYTDEKIDAIVGEGASTTLDTIGEIAQAIEDNQDMLETLNDAIGSKANASDLTSHTSDTTVHITSTERANWDDANSKKHEHSNKSTLDGITSALVNDWNNAKTHADSTHARTDATKTEKSSTNGNVKINGTETQVYAHPNSGATAGTYRSVTVNAQGHVTAGSNPTLAVNQGGTGATDAATARTNLGITPENIGAAASSHTHSDYVNQNAFGKVTVGSTTITADAKVDTLTLVAGSNVTLTPDATNDKVTIAATDTVYTHPTYTAKANGLYKVTVDDTGHVSGTTAVTKADITALGIPASDTNTHYASKNVVGSSTATSNTTSALTNGNVYLNSVENGAVTSTHKISGSGATTVTSDDKGNIVISSTDTNTTYSNFVKSGSGAKAGLVPAPSTTAGTTKYLREDGTWTTPPDTNTTYSNFVKSGTGAKSGLVPAPSTTAGTTKYLREDGTWVKPPNTTYSAMTGATASAEGKAGLVPKPAAGDESKFLKGDGTWSEASGSNLASILLAVYPVGSIYMSTANTNPGTIFGGTWESWGSGRVPVGVNSSDTNFSTVEKTGGASTVTLTTAQMPSHTHTFTGSSATTGNQSANHTHSGTTSSNGSHYHSSSAQQISETLTVSGTTLMWTNARGNGSGGTIASSGSESIYIRFPGYTTNSTGAHTHTMTTGNNSANHTHTVTAKGSNSNTGSGNAHSNLQPYITCYMWKRTA